ncbi:MAG TPA: hypothetical protein VGF17_17020 [Phytomonospora sp.]|nr:hypothetical protein [Streptomycetaceae bacterium]
MAKSLTANVYVDGVLYGPAGEQPSAEVAKAIVNPKAWDGSDADSAPAGDAPAYPEGDPSEDWTGKQLDAYAADKNVDLAGASTKADKVAAIQAATSA